MECKYLTIIFYNVHVDRNLQFTQIAFALLICSIQKTFQTDHLELTFLVILLLFRRKK